ncbi:MAG: peptidoglycan editing factor PgeF [Elusimicrobiota bacterium]
MWQLENGLWKETGFPFSVYVTTRDSGDMRDAENRKRFCLKQDIDFGSIVTAEQVHGKKVTVVAAPDAGKCVPETDGLISKICGIALAVFTADCLPVFFGNKDKNAAGIVHAGWKGLHAGIIKEAVELLKKTFGLRPEEVSAAIGPHIQKCCYETGPELFDKFGIVSSEKNLDLSAIALKQLDECGIKNVSVSAQCTHHEHGMFFSYRKDKTNSRIMSLIRI